MKYRCLVVDDEPIARKIVKNYIAQMPNLVCMGECKNATEAIEKISCENIEIVFLDISMPNISGISMVKILSKQPLIIFTTAYTEFAIESYELNAVDYLLKPFLFERFAKAVAKAMERLRDREVHIPSTPPILREKTIAEPLFFIKSKGENYPVVVNDILYCEAMKNYTKIILKNGKTYFPLTPLSKFEEELTALNPDFVRVHRSFIISKKEVRSVGANFVMVDKAKIPIGNQYKEAFLEELGVRN
jgi:DNA-binding LytR/AlgR family response regulator